MRFVPPIVSQLAPVVPFARGASTALASATFALAVALAVATPESAFSHSLQALEALRRVDPKAATLTHEEARALADEAGIGAARAASPPAGTTLTAASHDAFAFDYVAGRTPIETGGAIRLAMRHVFHWSPPQTDNPAAPGYVTVSAPDGVATEIIPWPARDDGQDLFLEAFPWQHTIDVRIIDGVLDEGDVLTIVYGDQSEGGAGARIQPSEEADYTFRLYASAREDSPFLPLADDIAYTIEGGPAVRLRAIAPSNLEADDNGETVVPLLIRAEDAYGNHATGYQGVVAIHSKGEEKVGEVRFPPTAPDAGTRFASSVARIAVPIKSTGAPAVLIASDGALDARSNPVKIAETPPTEKTFWGDIHGHTLLSDGRGSVVDFYAYCRDAAALDFCAVTDHGYMIGDAAWKESKKATEAFNRNGEFVTLQAYEWSGLTNVGGDHNIYFRSGNPPIYRSRSYYDYRNQQTYHGDAPQINFIEDLYATLLKRFRQGRVLSIPHYGGRRANPAWHDPRVERLIEIFSDHRRSHTWAYDFLARGQRLGIIASTDGHIGRPGNSFLKNPLTRLPGKTEINTALVAVKATALTREAIFDALYARRTYATTGERILLDFAAAVPGPANGEPIRARMGEELEAAASPFGASPTLTVEAVGTGPIDRIEIYRNVKIAYTEKFGATQAGLAWTDPHALGPGETAAYWVRLVQADGEEAISSPIWATASATEQEDQ